eukprot:5537806-Prymnesium_polylepis.1
MESWRRRGVAVEEVACQQSDAQRSAEVRAKRKAGKLPTPPVKRLCEYAGDMAGDRDVHGLHLPLVAKLQDAVEAILEGMEDDNKLMYREDLTRRPLPRSPGHGAPPSIRGAFTPEPYIEAVIKP